MTLILNALIPVFLIILIGYTIRSTRLIDEGFWPASENLVFYFFLPVLFFFHISQADFTNFLKVIPMAGVVVGVSCLMIAIITVLRCCFPIKQSDYSALVQGAVQSNAAFIGIPIALGVFGQNAMVLYAMMLALVAPVMNSVIIIFFLYLNRITHKKSLWVLFAQVIFHPMVVSCILGMIVSFSGFNLPSALNKTLASLSSAALPIGLLIVGGALNINATKGARHYIFIASFLKLILLPLITILITKWFDFDALSAGIVVLYTLLPTSAASYVIAKTYHSNYSLTAGIIVSEVILSAITMPLILTLVLLIF
jgi:predicted permease